MVNALPIRQSADGHILSDPNILGGQPVFAGMRVPARALFEYLVDGLSLDYFLETFPSVSREQAVGVLRYEQQRLEHEMAA